MEMIEGIIKGIETMLEMEDSGRGPRLVLWYK